ncbi:MAG: response regulator [Candidatus Riflebacteria bacterium]|nr:response regulator [Candidatus Riflebacteria bacterium]
MKQKSTKGEKVSVLLVEDEELIRETTKRMLEHLGYEVHSSENGRNAVEALKCRQSGFSCVILDLTMPEMSGEDVYREIRKIDSVIPVILSSGHSEQDSIRNFPEKDIAGFLQKPYLMESLDILLKKTVEKSQNYHS